MLSPELQGRDLRISSQTGSGKTVAIGLAIRDDVRAEEPEQSAEPTEDGAPSGNVKGRDQRARPRALVVTPTRELAKQVEEELTWLYAPLGAKVTCVTGGGGYRDELRAFRSGPAIIVGTPGRLLDHLKRGAIDASAATAVVLDEADRMLDLGFREDLLAILGHAPPDHRTHLVSATFPREVRALADRVQTNPVNIEGTPLGTANLDIEHVIHLVHPRERLAAIINLLLEKPGGQTLVFARTRADVADITDSLLEAGFNIAMLSGEMDQAERNRALAAFKRGNVDALVATDVAARGIDVQDVTRVLHAEPPTDADAYTHRSGRTGRAGKKGISSVLVAERELERTAALLGRARVRWKFAPIPTAEALRDARDQDLFGNLTADFVEGEPIDARSLALAERIVTSSEPARAVGRLVALALRRAQAEPRDISLINPPNQSPRGAGSSRRQEYAGPGAPRSNDRRQGNFVAFRVSWGESHGAETRRLVAMMCRRGKIEGRDIGAIRVGRTSSVIEVSSAVADDFERATAKPDPRDPRVHVRRWVDQPGRPDHRSHGRPDREEYDAPEAPPPPPPSAPRIPKERESTARIPKERESTARIPKERESTARIPKERESTARIPKDRASVPKERESTARIPKDRASVPKERESTARIPKDRASVPKERESTARIPKDRASVAKDRETVAEEPKPTERPAQKPDKEKRKPWQGVQTSSKKPGAWRPESSERASPERSGPPQRRESGPPRKSGGPSGPPWRREDNGPSRSGPPPHRREDSGPPRKSGSGGPPFRREGDSGPSRSGPPPQRREESGPPAKRSGPPPWRKGGGRPAGGGGHGPPKRRGPPR
jgi:ATP-dependent RNA helicase DeaD